MRTYPHILSFALFISLASSVMCTEPSATPPIGSPRAPHVVLILADDLGYSDLGCYGSEIRTPNLDRLAAEGLRFTQMYSTGRCWPSRSALMTGYYAQQIRMDPPQGRVPAWTRFMPQQLKPLGYRCYESGKWHISGAPRVVADAGFDHAYWLPGSDDHFAAPKHALDDKPLPPIKSGKGYYSSIAIADHAIDFLKEHQSEHRNAPFMLYLAFTAPHFPLQALPDDIACCRGRYDQGWDEIRRQRYARQKELGLITCDLSPMDPTSVPDWNLTEAQLRKNMGAGEVGHAVPWKALTEEQKKFQAKKMEVHAAMIERMDTEIGRVLEQVQRMGALDNTLVLFVSDNGASAEQIIRGNGHDPQAEVGSAGCYVGMGPGWASVGNTPFRLYKSWSHEGGISSPCIVRWPAGIKARGEFRSDPCHFIDVLPTIMAAAGSQPRLAEGAPVLPGLSLLPAFTDGRVVHDDIFFRHHASNAVTNSGLRMGDFKIVRAGEKTPWSLFDLAHDRSELHDLAQTQPDRVRHMANVWERHYKEFQENAGPVNPLGTDKKSGRKKDKDGE